MNRALRTGSPVRVTSVTSMMPRPVVISTRRPARVATISYVREPSSAATTTSTRSPFMARADSGFAGGRSASGRYPEDTVIGCPGLIAGSAVAFRPSSPGARRSSLRLRDEDVATILEFPDNNPRIHASRGGCGLSTTCRPSRPSPASASDRAKREPACAGTRPSPPGRRHRGRYRPSRSCRAHKLRARSDRPGHRTLACRWRRCTSSSA